ncbi:hypothetical protein [Comamonas sp. C24C]
MSESTELTLPAKESALAVYSAPQGLDPYLKKIKDELDAFVPDVKTKKGREADKAHRQRINRAALDALVAGGLSEADAKTVITLIAKKAIPAVSITY